MSAIVCAVDGSLGARAAVRAAAGLSGALGLRLVLAHVANPDGRERGSALLDRVCREHGLERVAERRLEVGDRATGLARIAREEAAAVLVVGSHGGRALRRSPVGDLTVELCSASSCPVLVAPPGADASVSPSREI